MSKIKWLRSEEGFVDSHDGRWSIVPLYFGCVKPQWYELYDNSKTPRLKYGGWFCTQKEAKFAAEFVLSKEEKS